MFTAALTAGNISYFIYYILSIRFEEREGFEEEEEITKDSEGWRFKLRP